MTRRIESQFTVDTGLFRQLGELLVGRDATALVELIKNAYDADATHIVLRGDGLEEPARATLIVADNGTGMTDTQFRRGFLRLAARGKTEGTRRSPLYQRRYTGEKGVGRLAAHKLAAVLDVFTSAAVDEDGNNLAAVLRADDEARTAAEMLTLMSDSPQRLVLAQIDWDLVESVDTLSDVAEGLQVEGDVAPTGSTNTGTTLTLSRLRHTWTHNDLRDVVRQLNNFAPPPALDRALPRSVVSKPLLFAEPRVRDADRHDPGLNLELEGDFENPEEFWGTVHRKATWVLEIRAARGADIAYSITPTRGASGTNQFASGLAATRPHPAPDVGPFFDARILLRPGQVPTLESSWTEQNSGVRVYLEGFRVLPYGEPRNDWLSLDYEYTKRTGRFQLDPLLAGPGDQIKSLRALKARDVSLRLFPSRAFFGAVFLTEDSTGGLRTLVNREGFVPDDVYDRLVTMVKTGLVLLHRAHAAASYALAEHERQLEEARKREEQEASGSDAETEASEAQDSTDEEPEPSDEPGSDDNPDGDDTGDGDNEVEDHGTSVSGDPWSVLGADGSKRGSAAGLLLELEELRRVLRLPPRDAAAAEVSAVESAVQAVESAADELIADASLMRVLASVGAQLTAFTHEIAQLIPTAAAAESALAPIPGRRWPPEAVAARRAASEVHRALERQAAYLVDVASTEGRRRRTRHVLRDRVDAAFLGLQSAATAREVALQNLVAPGVKTPPVFRAEIQAVLTNLLTNAIKAAGSGGRVTVAAEQLDEGVRIRVENTGTAVDPAEAEALFAPYVSTTTEADPLLGQGMGLGLPITRDLVSEYGGSVRFVQPDEDMATAVEVVLVE